MIYDIILQPVIIMFDLYILLKFSVCLCCNFMCVYWCLNEHTYLHRIGRSGRWGRKGIAINFQTRHDHDRLKKFQDYYKTIIKLDPIKMLKCI